MNAPSAEALALLDANPAIDLHADTLMWARYVGYDMLSEHTLPLPRGAFFGHVDVPRMERGRLGAQFFGLVSLPVFGRTRGLAQVVHEQIDQLEQACGRGPKRLRLVLEADQLRDAERDGARAALLGIEGAHALEGDVDRVAEFARRGVRYLGLLHFSSNELGAPAYGRGADPDQGLTRFGREVVAACEAAGVLVDLAHINRRGFLEAAAMARVPPIVSHTGVLGAFEHWRNIDDSQLRAVADKGGCVGVIFCPRFLGGDDIAAVVKHLRHIVDTVGEEHTALGSDWDGMIVPTRGLADPTGLPHLVDALLADGFSPLAVRRLLRDNVLRVLRDAPRPALTKAP